MGDGGEPARGAADAEGRVGRERDVLLEVERWHETLSLGYREVDMWGLETLRTGLCTQKNECWARLSAKNSGSIRCHKSLLRP
jgi:hypothetical protein